MFRCNPLETKSIVAREVEQKAKELADYIRRNTAEGKAELHRQWNIYWESKKDKAFQSFKDACGIVERKRGRPCKSSTQAQGTAA